jgi:Phage-related minor tail protein
MSQARSQVQVSIVAQLGQGFSQAFQKADKTISGLSKSVKDANKAVGDVSAYRKQQDAVKQAGYSWQAAKIKADAFRESVAAQGAPTRKQAADLAKLERATERAGAAFTKERNSLAEMGRALQQAGVNTGKLTDEQARLTKQLQQAQSAHERAEKSLARQQAIVRGISSAWQGAQKHAAGAMAAGMVVGAAGRKALPYDEQLARLADTATAGGGDFGGAKTALSKAVQDALKAAGGGTREEALSGLNTLIATGGMSVPEAIKMMPLVARGSFGSGTGGQDIAGLLLRMREFGVDPERGLNIAMRSGQLGGVELRDMAKYMPEQMASARSAGYGGDKGLAAIASMNQVALSTAGNPEQAANNVTNLLNKLSSPELSKNITKVAGVDFDKYALGRAQQGVFKAEAFAEIADKKMLSDPKYRALKAQAEKTKGPEQAAIIKSMAAMMEGSGMGQLIQDRQALAAALSVMFARRVDPATGKSTFGTMMASTLGAGDVVGQSSSRLSGETFAQAQRASENLNAANEKALNDLRGPVDSILAGFNSLTETFPKLTSAAYAAAVGLGALAAYGLGGGIVGKVLGGGAATGGGAAAGAGAAGTAAGAASRGGLLGRVLKIGGPMMALAGLANFTTSGEDAILSDAQKQRQGIRDKYGSANVDAAFKAKRPWYIGNQDAASPRDLEGWVKAYMGEKDAAAKAATAASEAAKAAQNRPNITNQNTYNLSVTAPPGASAAELGAQLQKMLQDAERKRDADARSLMFDKLGQ